MRLQGLPRLRNDGYEPSDFLHACLTGMAPSSSGWDFPWFQRGSIIQSTPIVTFNFLSSYHHHHHPPPPPIFDGNLPRTNFSFSQNTRLRHLPPLRSPGQSAGSSAGSKWCLGYHPLGGTQEPSHDGLNMLQKVACLMSLTYDDELFKPTLTW